MVEENTSPLSDYPSKPLVTEHLSIHSQDPLNTSVNSPLFQSDFYLHPTSPSESGFSMDSMHCSSTEMSTNYYNSKSLSTAPVLRRTGSRQYLSNLNPLTSSSYSTATKEPGLKRKSSRINLSLSMTSSTNSVPTSILLNDRMPSLKTDLLSRRLNMSEIPKKNRYNLINSDQVSAKRRRANYMRLYQNRLIQSTFNSKKSSEEPALLKSILQKIKKLKQPHEKPLVYTDECHENSNNNQILMKGNRENMFNMVVQDSQVWSSHQLPIYSRSI